MMKSDVSAPPPVLLMNTWEIVARRAGWGIGPRFIAVAETIFQLLTSDLNEDMINLGLKRIIQLLNAIENPHLCGWMSVHVAGTNGKGSVCAYMSGVINEAKIANARFNSPHLVDQWDCIQVNGRAIDKEEFLRVDKYVRCADRDHNIGATPFEILTAVAYECFRRNQIEIAVVEAGMGGRLDSTNVLAATNVLATVITKIGLDHEGLLGKTLDEIAWHKAGIIKQNVPCIVDKTNSQKVVDVIKREALEKKSLIILAEDSSYFPFGMSPPASPLLGSYQTSNLACAWNALFFLQKRYSDRLTKSIVEKGIENTQWPGRLQWISIGSKSVLLDGAHNPQSAQLLDQYITETIRPNQKNILFIMAFTQGKDYSRIIDILVKPGDRVICTQFGPVDGMPWISAQDCQIVAKYISSRGGHAILAFDPAEAIDQVETNTVICGSLYLIGNVLRNLRQPNIKRKYI